MVPGLPGRRSGRQLSSRVVSLSGSSTSRTYALDTMKTVASGQVYDFALAAGKVQEGKPQGGDASDCQYM